MPGPLRKELEINLSENPPTIGELRTRVAALEEKLGQLLRRLEKTTGNNSFDVIFHKPEEFDPT